jgi:hypothetical protein
MKVSDLIELLKMENPDADVHFQYNYGDHWRTQVAPKVRDIGVGYVQYSEYHRMDKVTDDEDDIYLEDGERDEDVKEVVLLGG